MIAAIALGAALGLGWLCLLIRPAPRGTERTGRQALADHLRRAGFGERPRALAGVCATGMLAGLVTVAAVGAPPWLVASAGLCGAGLPILALSIRNRARHTNAEGRWPDLVDHIVAALRSGEPLPHIFTAVQRDTRSVFRDRLRVAESEWAATGRFDLALDRWKAECADPCADRIAEVLRMAHDVGGRETIDVLRDLGRNLRDDDALTSEIRSRRTWVTNTARLGVAAPWIVLVLLATRPEAAHAYATPSGAMVVALGLLLTILAYRVVLMIGRPPRQRRWLA